LLGAAGTHDGAAGPDVWSAALFVRDFCGVPPYLAGAGAVEEHPRLARAVMAAAHQGRASRAAGMRPLIMPE
jgi:hypothetical protein